MIEIQGLLLSLLFLAILTAGSIAIIAIYVSMMALLRTLTKKLRPPRENTCVCCGVLIPEGRQVCPKCEGGRNNG